MSQIEALVANVGSRLGIGPEAAPLVKGLLQLVFGGPKGFEGFLDLFKSSGLGGLAASWIGKSDNPPLGEQGAAQAFGYETIAALAEKAGLDRGVVTAALAYLAPKLVGLLTPGGAIPASAPPAVAAFLAGAPAAGAAAAAPAPAPALNPALSTRSAAPVAAVGHGKESTGLDRYIIPGIGALLAIAFVYHFFTSRPEPAPAPAASQGAASPAPAALTPARFGLSEEKGAVTASGVVSDDAARSSILDSLKKAFGDKVSSAISVEPNVAPAPWLAKLAAALEILKVPGLTAAFEGSKVNLGGAVPPADLAAILAKIKALFGDDFSVSTASSAPPAANFASLKENFTAQDLIVVLNGVVLNFDTGSWVIDDGGKAILVQAAALIKKLPSATVVHVGGYTDRTGDPDANVTLSQHRADAVRQTLIDAGVAPTMLTAKGYGSAASTNASSSRTDRRIEFTVSQ
ncbi:OmpA family protein [Methylocella silvestris]|uniref:OmpA-like domain-containing protein n=1 Tax=Methylocella silvestris TaxID=199596 RepID=A0A2J7THS6_METSI|nr:OmpA family protein [Methylocella silvestris]PNG26312.1 hypothetical protein CR492_09365 [Methylocella silvestris]